MILPAKWQQTFSLSQNRVIGDVDAGGQSIFRNSKNRDVVSAARMDLAYGWTNRYQTGVSLKYQNRARDLGGDSASNSGWSDVGLSQAFQAPDWRRLWFFQSLNIPTANSNYDARERLSVDAHGTGTYQFTMGVFNISNFKEWDVILSPEAHYSFAKSFKRDGDTTELSGVPGASFLVGAGYIPWRSKTRYGLSMAPRYEGSKTTRYNGEETKSDPSLVWDTSINVTRTINAEYALGLTYLDQTIFGPARNTLLNRSLGVVFQARWP